jgi:PAS domain S-box-containing protein
MQRRTHRRREWVRQIVTEAATAPGGPFSQGTASRGIFEKAIRWLAEGIVNIDERGRILFVNPAAERIFGYGAGELIGRDVSVLMPQPWRSRHRKYVEQYLRTGTGKIIGAVGREVVGLHKDGGRFPLELAVSEVRLAGKGRIFTGILHDLTERRRLEREVLDATVAEQRRIGQDLHDGLCQQLAGVAFGVELFAQKLLARAPGDAAAARKIGGWVDEALTQARAVAHGLNPVDLKAGGLAPALKSLAAKVSDLFRVECRFASRGRVKQLCCVNGIDAAGSTHLYRIAQEAVSNAVRHGRAKRIDVTLEGRDGTLILRIGDNGSGIGRGAAPANGTSKGDGMGIRIMQYRARLIGASLTVAPGAGSGTVVSCSLECATADTDKEGNTPCPSKGRKHPRRRQRKGLAVRSPCRPPSQKRRS